MGTVKLLGAILILSGGLLLGIEKAVQLQKRVEALVDLKRTIQVFRTGVSYCARPLGELISAARDSPFCLLAAAEPSFFADPKEALEQAGKKLLRAEADRELYQNFVRGLGVSDTQSQLEHMALYDSLLENSLAQAREARAARSRLYVGLGLFGGAAVCLLLL